MINKVLVTGASGFVGVNLMTHFRGEAQYDLVPLNLRKTLSVSQMDGISAVIHLAGKAHDLKKHPNLKNISP